MAALESTLNAEAEESPDPKKVELAKKQLQAQELAQKEMQLKLSETRANEASKATTPKDLEDMAKQVAQLMDAKVQELRLKEARSVSQSVSQLSLSLSLSLFLSILYFLLLLYFFSFFFFPSQFCIFVVINYNFQKPIPFKGSAIFLHLTKNLKGTAGCIALNKKDLLILLKLINKKTKIKIY